MSSYRASFPLSAQAGASTTDWLRLIPSATDESLLPALWQHIQSLHLTQTLPPDITQLLQTTESLNRERNQHILTEAIHIAALLNQIDIQPIALKGLAYLLTGVYPDPAARYLADIDLLIPAHQLPTAVRHLLQNGFSQDNPETFSPLRHHHAALSRPQGPHVELHHQIGIGICRRLLPASQILAQATPISIQGATILLPSPTHLAMHLIIHSQLAHPYHDRVFPPLRAIYDLVQLQAQFGSHIHWPRIQSVFSRFHHSATLQLHLAQARDILEFIPPIPLHLGFSVHLRLLRRRLLNRYPRLRYIDPFYLFSSLFSRRFRLIPGLLRNPQLWFSVLKRLFDPALYRTSF